MPARPSAKPGVPELIGKLDLLLRRLTGILMVCATIGGAMMAVTIVASATARYVMGAPLAFQEELVGLFFVALAFLSLPDCTMRDGHIAITALRDLQSAFWRRLAHLVALVASLVFTAAFTFLSYDFAALSYLIGARSDVANLTLYPWMALMPLGMGLTSVVLLLKIVRHLAAWTDSRTAS